MLENKLCLWEKVCVQRSEGACEEGNVKGSGGISINSSPTFLNNTAAKSLCVALCHLLP